MNLKNGFDRLAKVAAVCYGLITIIVAVAVVIGAWSKREQHLNPTEYVANVQDGRVFQVLCAYQWEAQEAANDFAARHPAVGPVGEEAFNKPTSPIRLSLPEYDNPPTLASVIWPGGLAIIGFACGYPAILGLFQTVKWVALGFITPFPKSAAVAPVTTRKSNWR